MCTTTPEIDRAGADSDEDSDVDSSMLSTWEDTDSTGVETSVRPAHEQRSSADSNPSPIRKRRIKSPQILRFAILFSIAELKCGIKKSPLSAPQNPSPG
jgi:hypothetical protein